MATTFETNVLQPLIENNVETKVKMDEMLTNLRSAQRDFERLDFELKMSGAEQKLEEKASTDALLSKILDELRQARSLDGASRADQKQALARLTDIRKTVSTQTHWDKETKEVLEHYLTRVETGLSKQSSLLAGISKGVANNADKIGAGVAYALGNSPLGAMIGGFLTERVKTFVERRQERRNARAQLKKTEALVVAERKLVKIAEQERKDDDTGKILRTLRMQTAIRLAGGMMGMVPRMFPRIPGVAARGGGRAPVSVMAGQKGTALPKTTQTAGKKAARSFGKMALSVLGKGASVVGRLGLRMIPGVGWALLAHDVADIGSQLLTGKSLASNISDLASPSPAVTNKAIEQTAAKTQAVALRRREAEIAGTATAGQPTAGSGSVVALNANDNRTVVMPPPLVPTNPDGSLERALLSGAL